MVGTVTGNPNPTFDIAASEQSTISVYPGELSNGQVIAQPGAPALATNLTQPIPANTPETFQLSQITNGSNTVNVLSGSQYFSTTDGTRYLVVTATDASNNIGAAQPLTFFLDTENPVITNVTYNTEANTAANSVYSSTPIVPASVTGITIYFQDPAIRDTQASLAVPALNPAAAENVANYTLTGVSNGAVAISNAAYTDTTVLDGDGEGYVHLTFASNLPEDSFNLDVSDNVVNEAGNGLYGQTYATPGGTQTINFPTGYSAAATPETAIADFAPGALTPAVTFGVGPTIVNFEITPDTTNNTGLALTQSPPIGTITSNVNPTFDVTAANGSKVSVYQDVNDSGVLAPNDPLLGTAVMTSNTQTFSLPANVLSNSTYYPSVDGTRYLLATVTDASGDVGPAQPLVFFLDTEHPYITTVTFTNNGANAYSSTLVPATITGLTITFEDPAIRDSQLFVGASALNDVEAHVVSNYTVTGSKGNEIPITAVNYINTTSLGGYGETTIQLSFANPLPSDSYSLAISDSLVNDADNALFGGTFATPGGAQTINFPTGYNADGTTETAPANFDPGADPRGDLQRGYRHRRGGGKRHRHPIHRPGQYQPRGLPLVAPFALPGDVVFSGNFPNFSAGTQPDGFSSLAAYGEDSTGQYRWLFENADGTTTTVYNPQQINGLPLAGNFLAASSGDGLALFTGSQWYLYSLNLDPTTNQPDINLVETVNWPTQGLPVVGDFDGDGIPDLATYNVNTGTFSIAYGANGYASIDQTVTLQFPGVRARPVAADIENDGMDDLGVWVPDSGGQPSEQKPGDWYFLETGGQALDNLTSPLSVVHYQFGSSIGVPVTGLFSVDTSGLDPADTSSSVSGSPMLPAVATNVATPAMGSMLASSAAQTDAAATQKFSGTSGSDVFQLWPGSLPGTWDLSINGVLRESNASMTNLKLDGLGGDNSLVVTGTGKDETAQLWSNKLLFDSGDLSLTATDFANITVLGGGNDTATLHDAVGANALVANAGTVTLSGNGYIETVRGFADSTAIAAAGSSDTADLYESTNAAVVGNRGGEVTLTDSGIEDESLYFNTVRIHAPGGAVTDTFTYSKTTSVATAPSLALPTVSLAAAASLAVPDVGGSAASSTATSISVGDVTVQVGAAAAQAAFTVSLSAASASTVTVTYNTANGTAAAGKAYTATSGTLTFAPGQTSKTITVPVAAMTAAGLANQTFVLDLAGALNGKITRPTGTATIVDVVPVAPSISVGNVNVQVGTTAAQAVFTVSLSAASSSTVTVKYSTADGTAKAAGKAYTAISGTLTFAPGQTSKTIVVPVAALTTAGLANQTFVLNLASAVNGKIANATATATIVDVVPAPPSVSIGSVNVTRPASGSSKASVVVSLSAASKQTVTVNYATVNGTAAAGVDYTAQSGKLTFAPGVTSQTILIPILANSSRKGTFAFNVVLSSPSGVRLGTSQAVVTINSPTVAAAPVVAKSAVQAAIPVVPAAQTVKAAAAVVQVATSSSTGNTKTTAVDVVMAAYYG